MITTTSMNTGRSVLVLAFFGALLCTAGLPEANAGGYPWKNHAAPYDFRFENDIDSHQQTQVKANGDLFGFLYVTFTGIYNDGIPVVEHCDGTTPPEACEVGWIIRGKFLGGAAAPTLVAQVGSDHPIWLVESRNDIPQPGAFSHFHWVESPGEEGGLILNTQYDGYILELQAVDQFYFMHNGEQVLVMPGIDIATHVNIVGSFP